MKPYTLEWWMDIHEQARAEMDRCLHTHYEHWKDENYGIAEAWLEKHVRFKVLSQRIYNRIIKKYGEK